MSIADHQNQPGDDIVDLRNVMAYFEVAEADPDYIELVNDLKDQYGNWELALTDEPILISDDYWVQYAMDYAEGIGAVEDTHRWPAVHINWDEAASSLQMDFTRVEFGGYVYWTRS